MYHIDRQNTKPDIGYMECIISKLMKRGVRLADCSKLMKYYNNVRDALEREIQVKYNIENPRSPKQIADFLSDMSARVELKSRNDIVNICYDSNKNKWVTRADALEKLADLGYEFAQDLLDYRHAKKYAESIESFMKASDKDGLIHPKVNLGKTHRINYCDPGLLTIPKKLLWHMIIPYTEGNTLYSIDIKNQEPSILINMTGAEELKYALESENGLYETMFKQCYKPTTIANVLVDTLPENRVYSIAELEHIGTISPANYLAMKPLVRDIFYNDERVIGIEVICIGSEKGLHPDLPETVSIETEKGNIYNVPVKWEDDTKKFNKVNDYNLTGELKGLEVRVGTAERKEFKTAWNAISYGASLFGVRESCKTIDGKQAYNYITKINQLKQYRNSIDKLAKNGTNVIGTIFGTRLYAGDYDDYKKLKRVLLDLPIQGSGADILSLLIKHFYDYIEEKGLSEYLSLYYTRHDELIIEVNKEWLDEVGNEKVIEILTDIFEHQIDDWTPFKIEVEKLEAEELGIRFDEYD